MFGNMRMSQFLPEKSRSFVRVSIMVAYFCHHLSDNYVDLSDLYVDMSVIHLDLSDLNVDLSDLYVDLSPIHLLDSKS